MDLIGEIGTLLVEGVFGSPMIAGVFFFGLMIAFGLAMRFTLDCWVVCMTPLAWLLMFHPETKLLPPWLWMGAAMILGVLIFLGVIQMVKRR